MLLPNINSRNICGNALTGLYQHSSLTAGELGQNVINLSRRRVEGTEREETEEEEGKRAIFVGHW